MNLIVAKRTPQQNGVAERKNRTLIKAARTMLADSKLPTTFWVEAVNTACYVQNRVLVIKPHNKTPYELFLGRKPALSFMRPFGCPVTILNTIDQLGKFDGNVDEGFFVGYSTNNALTNSMNYEPVVARNQSNGSAVTLKVSHLHAVKRIFRYLKGQPKLAFGIIRTLPFALEAYLDSDYAGASLDMKSTTGEAQIRFEAASEQSNDPPLSKVNTLGSGEDSMKLKELMEFYTKLSVRALDL
ncbi:retrovirus-related pol polyprotein from transposon TNT 1-94 [Tanacetum coccineum]